MYIAVSRCNVYNGSIQHNRFFMKLNSLAANQTVVTLSNGDEVFFSYRTPVECYIRSKGLFGKTETWYSATTTRHINKWLGGRDAQILPQSFFDELTL